MVINSKDVHEAFFVETKAFSLEPEAKTNCVRDRGEAETLEISTKERHYCTSRRSRDRGVKTEATFLINIQCDVLDYLLVTRLLVDYWTEKMSVSVNVWNSYFWTCYTGVLISDIGIHDTFILLCDGSILTCDSWYARWQG